MSNSGGLDAGRGHPGRHPAIRVGDVADGGEYPNDVPSGPAARPGPADPFAVDVVQAGASRPPGGGCVAPRQGASREGAEGASQSPRSGREVRCEELLRRVAKVRCAGVLRVPPGGVLRCDDTPHGAGSTHPKTHPTTHLSGPHQHTLETGPATHPRTLVATHLGGLRATPLGPPRDTPLPGGAMRSAGDLLGCAVDVRRGRRKRAPPVPAGPWQARGCFWTNKPPPDRRVPGGGLFGQEDGYGSQRPPMGENSGTGTCQTRRSNSAALGVLCPLTVRTCRNPARW